jgi:uncharacterized protein (DUF302 family)
MARYEMNVKVKGQLEDIKPRVVEALKAKGFGILTEIDIQKTMKQKLGVDFKPYQILGACNPGFAHQVLSIDESIGLLLPCNVVLRQDNDNVDISIQDPEVMFSVIDQDKRRLISGYPQEVKKVMQSVLATLQGGS